MNEKLTRREIREGVFLLLYQNEVTGSPVEECAEACEEAYDMSLNGEMTKEAQAVIDKYEELDNIIAKYSEKREVARIPKINKTILRLALYEINYYGNMIPPKGAVNEAIELAKKYSDKQDSSFINGVLGNYLKQTGKDAE